MEFEESFQFFVGEVGLWVWGAEEAEDARCIGERWRWGMGYGVGVIIRGGGGRAGRWTVLMMMVC